MGYQVGVTPLQMAAAVSAVANGGEYIEPRVVRAAYREDRRYNVRTKVLRRAIDADTAAALTAIMEQVVEKGTGTTAQIPGYTIAGKTGTANTLVDHRYTNDTYASFVGFLPSRDPKLTILVMLNSPHGRLALRRTGVRSDLQAHCGSGAALLRRAAVDQSGAAGVDRRASRRRRAGRDRRAGRRIAAVEHRRRRAARHDA
jgi:cell division protein FtsI/penicillin-binding protein 2